MDIGNSFFFTHVPWSWIVAGILLMAFELSAPGSVFLWFGIAALVTGAVTLAASIGWQWQAIVFALASIASLAVWRSLPRRGSTGGDPVLNERAARHVGRHFVLTEPLTAGRGHVRIDDTVWPVTGPDLAAGSTVVVTGVDGSTLIVRAGS